MEKNLTYLDTYILQQDMRIRLPKSILSNLNAKKGVSYFEVFLDRQKNELILRICSNESKES